MNAATSPRYPLESDLPDRRADPRLISVLRVGRAEWNGQDQLCVVRNLSAGGLMFECLRPPMQGQRLSVELRSDKRMNGIVRWVSVDCAGLEFEADVDIAQILREERNSLLRVRPRAPRFIRRGSVRLIGEDQRVIGDIVDISIGGLSCRPQAPLRRGAPIVASIEGIGATNAELRWNKGDVAGLRFEKPLPWRAFQLWLDQAPR